MATVTVRYIVNDVDAAMHIVAGTARSMGVEVGA